jgi:hypothetical protein
MYDPQHLKRLAANQTVVTEMVPLFTSVAVIIQRSFQQVPTGSITETRNGTEIY